MPTTTVKEGDKDAEPGETDTQPPEGDDESDEKGTETPFPETQLVDGGDEESEPSSSSSSCGEESTANVGDVAVENEGSGSESNAETLQLGDDPEEAKSSELLRSQPSYASSQDGSFDSEQVSPSLYGDTECEDGSEDERDGRLTPKPLYPKLEQPAAPALLRKRSCEDVVAESGADAKRFRGAADSQAGARILFGSVERNRECRESNKTKSTGMQNAGGR